MSKSNSAVQMDITVQQDVKVKISGEESKRVAIAYLRHFFDFPTGAGPIGGQVCVDTLPGRLEDGFKTFARPMDLQLDAAVDRVLHHLTSKDQPEYKWEEQVDDEE